MGYQMEGCSLAQDSGIPMGECPLDEHNLMATHDMPKNSTEVVCSHTRQSSYVVQQDVITEYPRMNQIIRDVETKARTVLATSKKLRRVRGSTTGTHLLKKRARREIGGFMVRLADEIESLPPMDLNIMDPMMYAESLEALAKELSEPVSISTNTLKMFIPFLLLLASDMLDI